jgi:putative ABC transport system permease protein
MYLDRDTTLRVIVGASIQPPRYSDYQQARDSYSILYKLSWYSSLIELCVRVRPDQDHDFAERLRADATKQLRVGNVFIADIRSFDDIRRNFQQAQSNQLRNYVTGMSFLLLNIFLGLLGTFWFRTQQRRGEIALHKVHGATSRVVFTRLLTEGILILTLVTLPALIIDYFLTDMELNSWHNGTTFEPTRFIVCAAITYLLIALMIAVGIGIPARRAMQVQPAEALHDE